MEKNKISKVLAILLAVIMCMAVSVPAFAVTPEDALAPLTSISIIGEKEADFKLAPAFQPNTQVYTVTNKTDAATMPTDKADALGIIGYTAPDGTTVGEEDVKFDAASQLLTITTNKGTASSTYYISFSDKAHQQPTTSVADINVKKILDADEDAKLDSLSFSYELIPVKIVDDTAPVGTTIIPLAAAVTDDDATDGTVTVTAGTDMSTMLMKDWNEENVPTLSAEDAASIGKTELAGKEMLDGTFSVTYSTVGQYVYLLHEVKETTAGVTYDESWYEVTVSAVHEDPNDPTTKVVVGWIEVKAVTNYVSNTSYTAGNKVNFGTDTTIDNQKYDNYTTSITYPFVNVLATEDLVVNKTVTGDLGDKNQEFLFKIDITGKNLGEKYEISYTDDATGLKPTEIAIDNGDPDDTGSVYLTLKHGVTATIAELPVGISYTITEIDEENENLATAAEAANYNTTITYDKSVVTAEDFAADNTLKVGAGKDDVIVGKAVTQNLLNTEKDITADKNFVTVNNDKPLTPPTGAFADMVPYIAIVLVALAGVAVYVVIRKRHNSVYEA